MSNRKETIVAHPTSSRSTTYSSTPKSWLTGACCAIRYVAFGSSDLLSVRHCLSALVLIVKPASGLMGRLAVVVLLSFTVFAVGSHASSRIALQAQEPPAGDLTATTLVETRIDSVPAGSVILTAASLTLAPGQATLPLTSSGSLILLVETGIVILTVDRAISGLTPDTPSDGATGPEISYRLRTGQRVTIPLSGAIHLRGEGSEPAKLLLITLRPEGTVLLRE